MVISVILLAGGPEPSASASAVLAYDQGHQTALEVAGCLGFAASLPLAIWTATVYRRLRTTLGVVAPGAVIGLGRADHCRHQPALTFALLTSDLDFTFPAGRYLWLTTASVLLPARRLTAHRQTGRPESEPVAP